MEKEPNAPYTDFSFFDESDQDFISTLFADDLAETIGGFPEDSLNTFFELWRTKRSQTIFELGALLGEDVVWSSEMEAEMTKRITTLVIKNPQFEPIFSRFVKDTMEVLVRGFRDVPEGLLDEQDMLKILEYHDELFSNVRKSRTNLQQVVIDLPLLDPSDRLN